MYRHNLSRLTFLLPNSYSFILPPQPTLFAHPLSLIYKNKLHHSPTQQFEPWLISCSLVGLPSTYYSLTTFINLFNSILLFTFTPYHYSLLRQRRKKMIPFRSFCGFETWLDQENSFINAQTSSKSERKSTQASKSHSHKEAERRRRQRINDHLSTLRSLLPNAAKSDKASLLAEVVEHLKRLKKQADDVANRYNDGESSSSCSNEPCSVVSAVSFPGESDEASVSYCDEEEEGEPRRMKVTVCCEDRPGLNRDLNRAILSVKAKAVRAEMMTVGGRTKSVVVVQCDVREEEKEKEVIGALERALKAVVEDRAFMGYRMGRVILGQKRDRDSYGSSSSEVDCSFVLGKEDLF